MIGARDFFFEVAADTDWARVGHVLGRTVPGFRWRNRRSEYGDYVLGESEEGFRVHIQFEDEPLRVWWEFGGEGPMTEEHQHRIERRIEKEILPAIGAKSIRAEARRGER